MNFPSIDLTTSSTLALGAALLASGVSSAQTPLLFTEATQAAGIDHVHAIGNAVPPPATDLTMTWILAGGATLDYDRDGHQDLFLLGGGGESDSLYKNQGDGTFKAISGWYVNDPQGPNMGQPHMGGGVGVGDFDDDGWLDMFVTSQGPANVPTVGVHRLLRNLGNGKFQDVARSAGVNVTSTSLPDGTSSAFGDYDLDGDLDLFVAAWRNRPFFSQGNRLFRNEGNGTFTDVTLPANIDSVRVAGFTVVFVDMNGDRYPELLVAADHGTSRYYVNNGDGTFLNFTKEGGLGIDKSGMGCTVGDLTGDGVLDWYITEVNSPIVLGLTGNKLYAGLGGDYYQSVAAGFGLNQGFWGWGTVAADFDNNGMLDLLEVNGWPNQGFHDDPDCLWLQKGNLNFVPSAQEVGIAYAEQGRGIITFDYDEDGDIDYVTTRNSGPARLFRNELIGAASNRHWLRVFLDTSNDPTLAPNGFGARVVAEHSNRTWLRVIGNHSSFLCWGEISAHFGLFTVAPTLETLRVEWPNGTTTTLTDVPVDQTITISAP